MPKIRLVLADIDGTLLPFGESVVRDRTLAAVHALRDAGILFGPASGRERCDLVQFFHGDESCLTTGIMGNGKVVYLDDVPVYRRPLSKERLGALVGRISRHRGICLTCYRPLDERGRSEQGFYGLGLCAGEQERFTALTGESFSAGVVTDLPEGDITTAAVVVDKSCMSIAEAQELLSSTCPDMDFPQSAPFVIDVLDHGWTKLSALPILLDHLQIGVDEVMYLGDSANDLTMMEAIPHAVCMGDGTEEARATARWVVDTCDNDGATRVMESLAAHAGELRPEEWV
ncbi:MAG: HAD family phosphatase [Atopobiaceae bacterium]|nr:HAD family phosphatase [Atopobiaceae bacterium]